MDLARSIFNKVFLTTQGILFLVAIALLGWQAYYLRYPGPGSYSSHYSGIIFASILAFDTLQAIHLALRLSLWGRRLYRSRLFRIVSIVYWGILAVSGFACAVSYGLTPKADATATQVLILLSSTLVLAKFATGHFSPQQEDTKALRSPEPMKSPHLTRYLVATGYFFNRLLKFVRFALSVLFIAGAIELAMQYRFNNPGTVVQITLDSKKSLSINHYCTTVKTANSSLPTIWFEGDGAHGITDFIGVQTILAEKYGRKSCSYDPPNFGWSSNLPSSMTTDLTFVFDPLVHAIRRENETKILAGWGAGGENVLRHAQQNPDTIKAVVLLDVSPSGIEWLDQQRAKNLTMDETKSFAITDLQGRVSTTQIILAIGLPWGILPVFLPANDTGYFDKSLYSRHHAQSLKEDLWALQYFTLRDMVREPFSPVLQNITVPSGLPVYMIATNNSGTDDASNEFYRDEKVQLGRAVAGGDLAKPVTWCSQNGCDLSFPVTQPAWTAAELMNFGV